MGDFNYLRVETVMTHSDQKGFQSLMSTIPTQNSNCNPVLGEEEWGAKGGRKTSSETEVREGN